ncbi:uncharacterized protein FIBRA_02347 [Fibroporia radiculosa]|uniref:Major facilitator superfamily (MFS) profile domain-containing protein n=1 Tax=Fibroporia radiculosa TaxID=599839 RepID=J4HUS3_9APHY|nr:uncharacterized protein FIBRA_02347 [Fibroporia radiculosa]CCM00317.1 predicted protein [Fibroporia radiculosa]
MDTIAAASHSRSTLNTMASLPYRVDPEQYHIYGHRRAVVVVALALVLFISALDSTIVSVALPVIGADFDDYSQASWIVTAYLITYTAFLPIVSKCTDIFGRRPVLVFSTLFFMLWSGACGGAKTMNQLIIFRALQGIGGSAIYSAVIVTISTIVPRIEIAKYTPMIGTVFAMSSVAGPLIGGAIVSHIHWGWIFFVNLPIGAIGTCFLLYGLKDPQQEPLSWNMIARRVDWIGSFLLLASSVLLSFALQVGGSTYPWISAEVLAPIVISVCLLPALVYFETRHPEPLIPLNLFNGRNYTLIVTFTLCLGAGFYTTTIFLPQRMEVVDLVSPITAGIRMLPQLLLTGLMSIVAGGIVVKTRRYRGIMWASASIGPIACGLLSILTAHTSFPQQYGFEALAGIAFGTTLPVSTIIVQFGTERSEIAAATGFQSFARQLGALIGIAADTAILNGVVTGRLNLLADNGGPLADPTLRGAILQNPAGLLGELDPASRAYVQNAYSSGFSKVFIFAAGCLAAGALATFGLLHEFPSELAADTQDAQKGDVEPDEVKSSDIESGRQLGVDGHRITVYTEKGDVESGKQLDVEEHKITDDTEKGDIESGKQLDVDEHKTADYTEKSDVELGKQLDVDEHNIADDTEKQVQSYSQAIDGIDDKNVSISLLQIASEPLHDQNSGGDIMPVDSVQGSSGSSSHLSTTLDSVA